jgi:hypothetical protein
MMELGTGQTRIGYTNIGEKRRRARIRREVILKTAALPDDQGISVPIVRLADAGG